MKAVIAALCDDVQVRDNGLMDITGAAPEWIGVDRFPWQGTLSFALLLQFEPSDNRMDLGLNVAVVRASDGAVVGGLEAGVIRQERSHELLEGAPPYLPHALDLKVELSSEGQHAVRVMDGKGNRLAFVVFVVRLDT